MTYMKREECNDCGSRKFEFWKDTNKDDELNVYCDSCGNKVKV